MDGKLLFYVTIFICLKSSFSDSDVIITEMVTNSDDRVCKSKMRQCSVKVAADFLRGDQGPIGPIGPMGPKGDIGERGPPGLPGSPGICLPPYDPFEITGDSALGEKGKPLTKLCKEHPFVQDESKTSNSYWMKEKNPFVVRCLKDGWTCLNITDNSFKLNYTNLDRQFWLSEQKFNITEFYGLTTDQISYLQSQASSARQTIRYNCGNSWVLPKDRERSLQILLWNDVLIGPYPEDRSPLFYSLLEDRCKESSETGVSSAYTDIRIETSSHRLPIIDFKIRDVKRGIQHLHIELKELCFV